MKIAFVILLYLIFGQCQLSFSQVNDSVCVHDRRVKIYQSVAIRKIDQADYLNYKINSEYFGRNLKGDSLYIFVKSNVPCLPVTTFVGEYTNADSIHFIDFLRSQGLKPVIQIENICGSVISRNQLPDLNRLVVNIENEPIKIVSALMYIQTDTGIVNFKLEDGVFSDEVKKCLMKMHEGQFIIFDGISVMIKEDPDLRTIQNPPGYVIKD